VAPFELEATDASPALDPLSSPVRLVELSLTVIWERGGKRREAHYRSLRAMLPESL
jgi:hypothetical protein